MAHAGEDADAYDGREHGEPDPREQRVEAAVLGFADDEALAGEDESPGGQRLDDGGDADARFGLPADFVDAVGTSEAEDSGGRAWERAVQGCVAGNGLAGFAIEGNGEAGPVEPGVGNDFVARACKELGGVGTGGDTRDDAEGALVRFAAKVLLPGYLENEQDGGEEESGGGGIDGTGG